MSISVIIPARNEAPRIGRCLQSLFGQSVQPRRIIVADDSDPGDLTQFDAAMKTLYDSDYPPSHLTYLRRDREEPWGISGGRNEAFKFVETEFVLPLDGDDWIAATFLEKTLAKIQEKEWIGIVSTLGIYHGEKEGELFGSGIDKTYEDELRENRISVCSLIRSKAVDAAGLWDTNLKAWEDWDMWLRILSLGWTHRVVKEPLLHYRLHHGGMNQWGQDNKEFLIQYMRKKYPGFME